jgi:hypothetical protein
LYDLKSRCIEIHQAEDFYKHQERIRAAARYIQAELPEDPALEPVRRTMLKAGECFENIEPLMASESKLRSDLLDPMEEAIQSYTIRYLQVFDLVTAQTEETRQGISALPYSPEYRALGRLGSLRQLGTDAISEIDQKIQSYLGSDSPLFPVYLVRANVERDLRGWPHPPGSPLSLQNVDEWLEIASESMSDCQDALVNSLHDKAALLHSDALRERLAKGKEHDFIARLLRAKTTEEVSDYLVQTLGGEEVQEPDPIEFLSRYLKKIQVIKLRLADFRPSKRTVEPADVEQVVDEFGSFLRNALQAGKDELPVIELE